MPRPQNWRSLGGGLLVLATLSAAVYAVLVYARVGRLHGKVITIYVAAPNAEQLIKGSEVWLAGQKVGVVKDLTFRGSDAPQQSRLIFRTHVLASAMEQIRFDSRAEIRAGGTAIGAPVIYLRAGDPGGRRVVDGDTLQVDKRTDFDRAISDASGAAKQLPAILANLHNASRQAHEASVRYARVSAPGGPASNAMRSAAMLRARLNAPRGSARQLLSDHDALVARVRLAMARADTIRILLATNRLAAIGQFRRDSTLTANVARLEGDLVAVHRLSTSPDGNLGRFRTDSALFAGADSIRLEMAALAADLKAHPLRYLLVMLRDP